LACLGDLEGLGEGFGDRLGVLSGTEVEISVEASSGLNSVWIMSMYSSSILYTSKLEVSSSAGITGGSSGLLLGFLL